MSAINRLAFKNSTFPPIFTNFLKDPSPLNSKKRVLFERLNNSKQLYTLRFANFFYTYSQRKTCDVLTAMDTDTGENS